MVVLDQKWCDGSVMVTRVFLRVLGERGERR